MENVTPLVAEIIALNDKKVAMALDDIIKLSKSKTSVNKGKKQRRQKNITQSFNRAVRNNTSKMQHYTSSLSAVRQGAIAKRRSNFQGHQYPVTTNFARKAATAPLHSVHGRAFNAGRMTSANQSRSRMLDNSLISAH
ncbi:unnamed protein product [Arabis nemorensis]|uniref:Uncharacterized protein n=1 Tax=Arabis nemorensis TaxID=586526 RepID=A0A565CDZ5_9BRAS|nr:unnamed protein product [Arabis nemorensis]